MAETNLKKSKQGYGYKYTELAQINEYLESKGISYSQYTQTEDGVDFIYTVPVIDGKKQEPLRGCRIVQAALSGKSNPAQEQGSAITYARRYSLLMAFGLATEDDDAESLTRKPEAKEAPKVDAKKMADLKAKLLGALNENKIEISLVCALYSEKTIDNMSQMKLEHALSHMAEIKAKAEEEKKK